MYNWKWKALFAKLFSAFDPAMDRDQDDAALEQAVKEVAHKFGFEYVAQKPVVGVDADLVVERGGLALCGIAITTVTGVPLKVLARHIEAHICQRTDVDWAFRLN